MKLLFVINSKAGPGRKNWERIISDWQTIRTNSNQVDTTSVYYLESAPHNNTISLQNTIQSFQPDRVVAIGGDGTIKLVAGVLAGSAIPMAIIPGGSANGMASELNIPANEQAALQLAVTGKAAPLDLIKINGEWCIHLSDIGLNATLLRYFEDIPQRGMLGYARALIRLARARKNTPRVKLTISANGHILRRKAVMAVIANATQYGTGAVINPSGRANDGWFELIIIRRLAFSELVKMLLTRRPFNPYNIETITCRQLEMHARPASPFQIDGEYRGTQSVIRASVFPGMLLVVRPV